MNRKYFSGKKIISEPYSWLLVGVLVLAFLIRTINLNFNSPFLDEAAYINLGKKFWNGNWQELAQSISWTGGFPFFFPPLAAVFHAIGGVAFSRFLNVILGVGSVYLIYLLTRQLFPIKDKIQNKVAGIIAASLMATSTIPIAFSRQVTYDALSLFLFLAGALYLARAIFEGESIAYTKAAALLFVAFLAKYIVAIYIPLLLLLTLYLAFKTGRRHALEGIISSFWMPLIFVSIIFIILNFSSLSHFFGEKTSEVHESAFKIIGSYLKYSPLVFAAAIGGFYYMVKKKAVGFAAILAFGASLPLFAHLAAGESSSVHQHSAFALVFLLPLVGITSAALIDRYKMIAVFSVALFVFLNFMISMPKVRALETFWPNTNAAVDFLSAQFKPGDKILAESEDPISLGLSKKIKDPSIEGPFDFSYQGYEGKTAYLLAIRDGYFNFIELDGIYFSGDTITSINEIIGNRYLLVFSQNSIKIWTLK